MNSLSTMFLVLSHARDSPLRYRLATRFGDDAFELELGRGHKELRAIAINMVAELDW